MASWKSLSPTSWEATTKVNGKVISTDTMTLSADGKTLTINTTGTETERREVERYRRGESHFRDDGPCR